MDIHQEHPSEIGPVVRNRAHLATGLAGVGVILLCGGYVLWSLALTKNDEPSSDNGISLKLSNVKRVTPSLTTPPAEPVAVSLTLDDRVEATPLPVVNADHEEFAFEEWGDEYSVSTSTIRPLTHEANTERITVPQEGAWLSGTIEPIVDEDTESVPSIAPFVR